MGWLPQSTFDELRRRFLALTPEEREALTWETARAFVAADTLELASWQGLRRSSLKPWQAVAKLRGCHHLLLPKGVVTTKLRTGAFHFFIVDDPSIDVMVRQVAAPRLEEYARQRALSRIAGQVRSLARDVES